MRLIKPLPDPFLMPNGRRVSSLQDWTLQRLEIQRMMMELQYGSLPSKPENISVNLLAIKRRVILTIFFMFFPNMRKIMNF